MLIIKFAYNNTKNTNNSHISFKLKYDYHLRIFFKDKPSLYLWSSFADKLAKKLGDLILINWLAKSILCLRSIKTSL